MYDVYFIYMVIFYMLYGNGIFWIYRIGINLFCLLFILGLVYYSVWYLVGN